MTLPNVQINYLNSQVQFQAQDFANVPCVIGASSLGTVGTIYTISQFSDLAQLGNGPAVNMLANILQNAQIPIFYSKPVTTNAGTLSSVTKIIGNAVGTPTTIGAGNSSIIFTAKTTGLSVTITQRSGTSMAATATFAAGLLTINLGTDGAMAPNSTPNAIVTLLNTVTGVGAAMTFTAGGTGLGIMVAASNTLLPFGSTGAATAAGTTNDNYNVIVKVSRAGSLAGSLPFVQMSFDGNVSNFTSDIIVPVSGILPVKAGNVDTGITLTLTGAFDVGDEFTFTTTAPTVGLTDIINAMQVGINDAFITFGHFVICDTVDRNDATSIDATVQAVKNTNFLQAVIHARDIAEGNPGETVAQWQQAISTDFAGFYVGVGLTSVFAGDVNVIDQYTQLIQRRSCLFGQAPIRAGAAIQESAGYQPMAYLASSPLDGKTVYYDERVTPGLDQQRFMVPCSRIGLPGQFFINRGWTLADPLQLGYNRYDYVNLVMEFASIIYHTCQPLLLSKLEGVPVAESNVIPAGALGKADADSIQSLLTSATNAYITRPQPRNNQPPGTVIPKPITVLRNYSFAATRQLRINATVQPLGTVESILVELSVAVPS